MPARVLRVQRSCADTALVGEVHQRNSAVPDSATKVRLVASSVNGDFSFTHRDKQPATLYVLPSGASALPHAPHVRATFVVAWLAFSGAFSAHWLLAGDEPASLRSR